MSRSRTLAAIAAASVVALAAPAAAHVTVQPAEAPAGAFFRFVVRVPNERPDAATTKVEIQFPESLVFVSFQPKQGWKRTVTMTEPSEPIEAFGEEIDEVVDTVTWSGGRIGPGEFDEFGFSARVPEAAGELEFPALQTYEGGEVVRWIGPADAEEPAARVAVVDLGAPEGAGELSLLADLRRDVAALDGGGEGSADAPDDDAGSSGAPALVSWGALVLAALALAVAVARRARAA
ncbi:MAG TPA: YcnI family protein [Actinomycetota bacterium]|nr:YcnI family protein [Actinomycetota bacterium]